MNIPDRNHSRKREQNPTPIQHWMKLMTLLSRATMQDMMEPNGVPGESKVIASRPRYARLAKTPRACEINNIAFCRVHMRYSSPSFDSSGCVLELSFAAFARVKLLQGDTAKARAAYQDFLRL